MRALQPRRVGSFAWQPGGAHNVVFKGTKAGRRLAGIQFDVSATVENTDGVAPHDMQRVALIAALFATFGAAWGGLRLNMTPYLLARLVAFFADPEAFDVPPVTFTAGQTQTVRFGLILPLCDIRARDGQTDTAQPNEMVEGQQLELTFGTGIFDTHFEVTACNVNVVALEIPGIGPVAPAILDVGFESYAGSKLALKPGAYMDLFIFNGYTPVSTSTVTDATVTVDGVDRYTNTPTRQLVQLANHIERAGYDEASPLEVPLLTPGGRDYVTTQLPLAAREMGVEAAGAVGLSVGWIRKTPRTSGDATNAAAAFGVDPATPGRVKTGSGKPLSVYKVQYAGVLPYMMGA